MRSVVLASVLTILAAVPAWSAPVFDVPLPGGYLDVDYFVGTGANTSYFVLDFGGNGGGTHAFGFRWEGSNTAADGWAALAAAGDLDWTFGNFGSEAQPNLFAKSFTYHSDTDEPDFSVDSRYWESWLGDYAANAVTWTADFVGISGRDFATGNVVQTLADGGFYGFYASTGGTMPRLPVAVPEPTSAVLLLLGVLGALHVVRRRGRN